MYNYGVEKSLTNRKVGYHGYPVWMVVKKIQILIIEDNNEKMYFCAGTQINLLEEEYKITKKKTLNEGSDVYEFNYSKYKML